MYVLTLKSKPQAAPEGHVSSLNKSKPQAAFGCNAYFLNEKGFTS